MKHTHFAVLMALTLIAGCTPTSNTTPQVVSVTPTPQVVMTTATPWLVTATSEPTVTATVTSTPTNTPIQTATATPQPPTLRDLAARIKVNGQPFEIGTTVDYGDREHTNPLYLQTASDEFNVLVPAAAFRDPYIDKYNAPRYWTDFAQQNKMTLRIQQLFWQNDVPASLDNASKEQVRAYMEERIRKLLPYVSKTIPSEIVLANEPFWEYQGKRGWQGEYGGNPLYKAFGEGWITEGYVLLYQIAQKEFNLTPGKDFKIIGIIERGIDSPGARTDWVIQQVKKIKQDISTRLGIPYQQIPFDLGSEFHVGDAYKDRDITIPFSKINKEVFKQTFIRISEETGCRMHASDITELTMFTGNENAVAESYKAILEAAIESGVVYSADFWANLSFAPDSPWQNDLILPGYKKGIVYKAVWDTLSKYASK